MADASVPDIGLTLHNARTQRGLSIEQVAQDTRISARFLEALETERFDSLPAPVYVRGFLRSYATYLRLDPNPLLAQLPGSATPVERGTAMPAGPAQQRGNGSAFEPEAPRARTSPQRSDPFRRSVSPAAPTVPGTYEAADDIPDERWHDDAMAEAAAFEPEPPRFYGRRPGVLSDDNEYGEGAGSGRLLMMAAGGVLLLLVTLATAVFLTQGDDDSPSAASATGSPTVARRTVIAVGSATAAATAASGTATVGAGASASPSATATPGGEATPTPDSALPTPLPTPTTGPGTVQQPAPTATPTAEPTATPEPTRTPTPILPTPTPVVFPTPRVSHPVGYSECSDGDCGPAPIRVICPPDGDWFVDVGKDYPNPGWPVVEVQRSGQAADACP